MKWTIRPHHAPGDWHAGSPQDDLLALGDATVTGTNTPIESDVGDTLIHVQRTLGDPSTTIDPAIRHRIWEDIMQAQVPASGASTGKIDPRLQGQPVPARPPSALSTGVARWQPAVSLFMVAAFLVSLVGLAWDRGVLDDLSSSQQPASETDPFTPDRPTPETPPEANATCEPRTGERLSDDELRAFSIADWNTPTYYNAKPASPEIAQMAIDTYLAFRLCQSGYLFGTPPAVAADGSPAHHTYRSDRMCYLTLRDTLPPDRRREVDDFLAVNPSAGIIESFPLPLNRDIDRIIPVADNSLVIDTFMVGEVYELPDGRYGAILGSISTRMLVERRPLRDSDGLLTFVGFWPEDGQLYIDEMLSLCVPGLVPFTIPPDATPISGPTFEGDTIEDVLGIPTYAACT